MGAETLTSEMGALVAAAIGSLRDTPSMSVVHTTVGLMGREILGILLCIIVFTHKEKECHYYGAIIGDMLSTAS
jgi:hypothetical protein